MQNKKLYELIFKNYGEHLIFLTVIVVSLLFISLFIFVNDTQNTRLGKVLGSTGQTYYISPTGSDSNTGTSTSSPWKTFAFAIPRLMAGDTLILMDGTYTGSTTGLPSINVDYSANNGTASEPITIKALNERKAFLKSDSGFPRVFYGERLSYWNIEGLYYEGSDSASDHEGIFLIYQSDHINLRRILGNKATASSQTTNYAHLMSLAYSHHILLEESEFYRFAAHAVLGWNSYNLTYRRNYANEMGWTYTPSADFPGGDGLSFYETHDSISENNIGENVLRSFAEIASSPGAADNNKFYGDIGIQSGAPNYASGTFKADARYGNLIRNTQIVDAVVINPSFGIALGAGSGGGAITSSTVSNVTILNLIPYPNGQSYGMSISNSVSTGQRDITVTNALLSASSGTAGFYTSGLYGWLFDYTNVYGGISSAWDPNDSHVTNSSQIDPQLGSCIVWIPETSPLKGAGKNEGDIGANILYRYQDGVLTTTPLWDTTTGEFPHGAIVAGVNDIAGSSAFDVNQRLNVNTNGCLFPSGYGK